MHTFGKTFVGILAVSLSWACSKTADRQSETGAGAMSDGMSPASRTRSAAEQIAESRCQRERQCGNVGSDKTYTSTQDCLSRIQSDWKDDLNARQCPGGINQTELSECLQEIRSEACENPFDTLARLTECTSGQICIEQP
jgi:hypothetical protein